MINLHCPAWDHVITLIPIREIVSSGAPGIFPGWPFYQGSYFMNSPSTRLNRMFLAAMLGGLLFCAGCGGTGTQLSATWTSPDYAKREDVDEVLVVAVTPTEVRRRIFEDSLVSKLQAEGISAYPSNQFHESVDQMDKEVVEALIKERGIEAIIVTRVLNLDRKEVVVPPSTVVTGYPSYGRPYYDSWYGYYSHGYSVTHDPGYTYTKMTVSLETNLYDTANGKLIWSGQSETFDPASTQEVIGPTTEIIVDELVYQKLLSPGKK